jgi:hypothetical protein
MLHDNQLKPGIFHNEPIVLPKTPVAVLLKAARTMTS